MHISWDSIWLTISHISNILSILSVIISFALWMSFGKFKKEIEHQKLKYVEEHGKILTNLNSIYTTIFTNDEKNDDTISDLRKQIYSINKKFGKLMAREDSRYIINIIKILSKDIDKIDYSALRRNLDCLIIAFEEKHYDY